MALTLEKNPPELYCPGSLAGSADSAPESRQALLASIEGPWMVALTKSRAEKALARHLHRNGVPYFLPLVRSRTNRQGPAPRLPSAPGRAFVPVFPGVVFVAAVPSDTLAFQLPDEDFTFSRKSRARRVALECPGRPLFKFLETALQNPLRRELAFLAESGRTLRSESFQLGTRVRYISGPLEGLEGAIEHLDFRNTDLSLPRVTVRLQLLGTFASVEVKDLSSLRILDNNN